MADKQAVERFLLNRRHVSVGKEDLYGMLRVLSAYESVEAGTPRASTAMIPRGLYDLAAAYTEAARGDRIRTSFQGGFPHAERGLMVFSRGFSRPSAPDLLALELELSKAAGHRDVLGAVLATGLKRSSVGDIAVWGRQAHVILLEPAADHLERTLSEVGAGKVVGIRRLDPADLRLEGPRTGAAEIVAASARADLVLAKAFHASRGAVKADLEKGKVKWNDFVLRKADHLLEAGDRLSCRGRGKFRMGEWKATTRKGNRVLVIHKYI